MSQNYNWRVKISKTKVLILASGEGSTFQHLVSQKSPYWQVSGLLTDRDCGALQLARQWDVPASTCPWQDFSNPQEWDQAMTSVAQRFQADLVLLAGFLRKLGPKFLATFPENVLNTHPSLLPQYGGQGMYGARIHRQVFANKELRAGVTIHWVDGEYDRGKILQQTSTDISDCRTAEEVESRVKALEKNFLVQTLNEYCGSQVSK